MIFGFSGWDGICAVDHGREVQIMLKYLHFAHEPLDTYKKIHKYEKCIL